MGLRDTIDASERYAKYKNSDDSKQHIDYLVWDKPGINEDVRTIYDAILRRLQSNNIPVTSDNLEKGFEALHKAFMEKIATEKESGISEQERDLREAMGTEDDLPKDPNAERNDWRTDQMKALSGEDYDEDEDEDEDE